MKRLFSLIMVLAMVLCLVPAQASAAEMSSEILIKPQYEDALDFSEGYAAVKKDGKWGYIDETGKVVVDFQFDWAGYFCEGVAVVATLETIDEMEFYIFRLIDGKGMNNVLMDSQNIWVPFDDALFGGTPKCFSKYDGIEEDMGEWTETYTCNGGVVMVDGSCYTPDGKEILLKESEESKLFVPTWYEYPQPFDYFSATGPAVDGVIPMKAAYIGQMADYNQAFLMDTKGNIIRTFEPANYATGEGIHTVMAPDQGLVLAGILYEEVEEYSGFWYIRYGVMDANNNWVIQPEYSNYRYFLNGHFFSEDALVLGTAAGDWGARDPKGNVVTQFNYSWLNMFSYGFAAAQKEDGSSVFVDKTGKEYQIGGIDGGIAKVQICSSFSDLGIAAVYDAEKDVAYCISINPIDGVFPAVANSDKISPEVYFPDYVPGEIPGLTLPPSEIVVIEENGLYGFMKLDVDVVINPFEDVQLGKFYFEPVLWAVENEITNGISATKFAPDNNCNRAQVVTFLHRSQGKPVPGSVQSAFSDVQIGKFYTDAVAWAVEKGVTNGMGDGTFGVDRTCTRGQVVTFLWRAAGSPAPKSTEHPFTDLNPQAFYYNAVLWAVENGITNGTTATTFGPEGTCTRGQIVTFLYRYVNQ